MPKRKEEEILTKEQVLLRIATELLGGKVELPTPAPARTARKERPVVKHLKKEWKGVVSKCPHCNKSGLVLEMFGVHLVRGIEQKYSWCRECRSTTNYHNKPRTYNTRNTKG